MRDDNYSRRDTIVLDGDLQEVGRWPLENHILGAAGNNTIIYRTPDQKVSVYSLPRHEHLHDLTRPAGGWSDTSCYILPNGETVVGDYGNKQLCVYSSTGEWVNRLYLINRFYLPAVRWSNNTTWCVLHNRNSVVAEYSNKLLCLYSSCGEGIYFSYSATEATAM